MSERNVTWGGWEEFEILYYKIFVVPVKPLFESGIGLVVNVYCKFQGDH